MLRITRIFVLFCFCFCVFTSNKLNLYLIFFFNGFFFKQIKYSVEQFLFIPEKQIQFIPEKQILQVNRCNPFLKQTNAQVEREQKHLNFMLNDRKCLFVPFIFLSVTGHLARCIWRQFCFKTGPFSIMD